MSQIKRKGEEKITKLLKGFVLYFLRFRMIFKRTNVCTNMQYE